MKKIFYGWWIIVVGSVISAMGGGFHFYGFTTFFLPISAELNLNRTVTSSVFSLARLEGAVEGPLVGWLIDRFGARKLLVIGLVFFGAGYIAMHWMNSLTMFFILYVAVISVGYQTAFTHTNYALANKWFSRQRSKATGILSSAIGVGGAALVPLLGWMIVQYGWRMAVVVVGASVLIVGLPLSLLVRNNPEDRGLLPDGDEVEAEDMVGEPGRKAGEYSFEVKEALKTSSFWILGFAIALRMFVVGGIWVHMVPLLVEKGFDQQNAANVVGLCLVFTIPARFFFGWLGDIYPKRYLLMSCCLIGTIALFILLKAESLWHIYLFVIIFAFSYGVVPLNVATVGEYFGRKKFATIRGIISLVYSLGIITGPIYAGYIYDVTRSYQVAYVTFIVVFFVAALVFIFARKPRLPAMASPGIN